MAKPRHHDPDLLSFSYFFPTGQTDHIWSDEAAAATPTLDRDVFLEMARAAEETGFDSLFIADTWSGHQREAERRGHQSPKYQAPMLAMGLFAVTQHMGVITTMHTSHHRPAHVARAGATLDAFSGGRWGWNVVTGFGDAEARLFGESAMAGHDDRYAAAAEFVEVVKRFWTEDEPIDHRGRFHTAQGRMKAPRPVQEPTPLLVSAGASPAGMAFAAEHCDQLVVAGNTVEKIQAVDRRLEDLLEARTPARSVSTAPFSIVIVREGDGEAEEEYERLTETLNVEATKELAADILGGVESIRNAFAGQDPQEAAKAWGSGRGILKFLGTAEQVTEQLVELKKETSTQNLLVNFPLWNPGEVRSFRSVLDHCRDAGIWLPPSERSHSW
ncbi:LLM class flavin-dependent oxidoreductase [Actinomycetospora corticicola]|uniref:FMNH2-dependent dimethyl sulfone monooxygenase n=1 Tax=Actinomycetospora corticicola TaxID=663602 RepID=A0A7Y9DSD9_9PSEU|nr:LLM class flavin-dependent oxidoreductase [Actinomycetospora corticicola]NYD34579.1 FMNH2-dependent dimethyl sulfone monooxygenase [Actinomycetospora corticicola]